MRPYQLGLYEKAMPNRLSLQEKLLAAKQAGYDYVELSIDESDEKLKRLDWGQEDLRCLQEAVWNAGIGVKSICLSAHRKYPLGHPDEAVRKQSLCIMQKAIWLAARTGIRLIQLAGYDVYYEPSTQATGESFAQGLGASVKMAAREGVVLAFETMETEFMNTVAKATKWVNRINSPYLQVYPDIGNVTNAALQGGAPAEEDLAAGQGHIAAVHLKETAPGVYREVAYGAGHVDFKAAALESLRLGARMFVGEFWHLQEENWPGVLRSNNEFLRRVLDEAARELSITI